MFSKSQFKIKTKARKLFHNTRKVILRPPAPPPKKKMLSVYPKTFSRAATYQKGIFPSENFPNEQFPKWHFPSLSQLQFSALSLFYLQCSAPSLFYPQGQVPQTSQPQCSGTLAVCGTSEGLTKPVVSCRLGNCTIGKLYYWELPPLGKCLRENTLKDTNLTL